MFDCDVVEKPLLERIQSELEADPDLYDVTFSVGPQKTEVKALKIILMAASPVLKNEFKTRWENAVLKDEDGIPLPEFDGESFQLFVKLTSLDAWSVGSLQKLNLPPNQLLNLLSICRRYEMRTAVKILEKLSAAFIKSFTKFKDTPDFLKLSQENLKEVLASDDLDLEETEVFKCALKWAEWKCKEKKIDASVDNLRHVLRDCLFEIRFPIMSVFDFTQIVGLKNLLTPEETLEIYKYIGLKEDARIKFDVKSLAFKSKQRNAAVLSKKVSNSAALQPQVQQTSGAEASPQTFEVKPSLSVQPKGTPTAKPRGCSTLSLLNDSRKIDAKTHFVCGGRTHSHLFRSEQRVAVVGLGFARPIDEDAFYDVTVELKDMVGTSLTGGTLKKCIYAKKNETFYFIFDKPITVEANPINNFSHSNRIIYSLTGPNASSIVGGQREWKILQEGSNRFHLFFTSNQLSEILFNKL